MRQIEVCGLGQMGQPISERLLAVGHRLVLRERDHSADNERELLNQGAVRPDGLADILILCLPDGDTVLEVLHSTCSMPALVVDCSSIRPDEAREAAQCVASMGGRYVDCPVSGSAVLARSGGLTGYVGANPTDPVIDEITALGLFRTVVAASGTGQGMALKLVNQAVHLGNFCALVEGAALADAVGLDPDVTLRGLAAGSAASVMLERFGKSVFTGSEMSQFSAVLAWKDIQNVLGSWTNVGKGGVTLTMATEVESILRSAINRLGKEIDLSAVDLRKK